MSAATRYAIRNRVSGLLVPNVYGRHKGEPMTFAESFRASVWITQQTQPVHFEVVEVETDA